MTPQEFADWEARAPGIDFKPAYVDVAGDFNAGVLLSQIIFYYLPHGKRPHKLNAFFKGEHWIAKTREQWFRETRFTGRRFDRAADILEAAGLIIVDRGKHRGNPTIHIRLVPEAFFARLEAVLNPTLFDSVIAESAFSKRPKRQYRNYRKGNNDIDDSAI